MYRNSIALLFLIPMAICSYIDWSPGVGPAKDLMCDTFCTDDVCCSCYSKPKWELGQESLDNLYVEYIGLGNISADLVFLPNLSEYDHLQAIHTRGRLRSLPRNTCDFKKLVKINFATNMIETIGAINCLKLLDTLILAGNRINHISNRTFMEMPALRVLDLSYNVLKTLDANAVVGNMTNIFYVNLSNNIFESVDISNVIRENYLFCKVNFENAIHGNFTNIHNITVDSDKHYNSGDMVFAGCSMEQDMFSVIFRQDPYLINKIPLMIGGSYYFENASVKCDCFVALYLAAHWRILKLEESLNGLTCVDQGNSTLDMYDPNTFDQMICNIHVNCPRLCTCIEQPTRWRIIVNCSFTQMERLPTVIPVSLFLAELLVSNNNIQHLEKRDYFNRLRILDLSDNGVNTIDDNVAESLGSLSKLDLENHNLNNLPKSFRFLDPNHLFFGNKGIKCTCNNTWIGDWRERGYVDSSNPLFCDNIRNGSIKTLVEVAKPLLVKCYESQQSTIILLSSFLCLSLISLAAIIVAWVYYFEMKLLLRTLKRKMIKDDLCKYKYDVFVSFDDTDEDSRRFVIEYLLPILETSNYTTYVPCRDMSVGKLREYEIKNTMQQARTFLCILSESYCKERSFWMRLEFMTAWDFHKTTEIINIDNLSACDVSMREIRAYLRLRWFISLTTRQDIFKQLLGSLGNPLSLSTYSHGFRSGRESNERSMRLQPLQKL